VRHRRGQPQVAQAQVAQQLQLLLEGLHQVLGRVAVVVVAAAGARHGDHQLFVEAGAQAVGAGGDALVGPGGALRGNLGGVAPDAAHPLAAASGWPAIEPERSITSASACGGRCGPWPASATGAWMRTSSSTVLPVPVDRPARRGVSTTLDDRDRWAFMALSSG